MPAQPLLNLTLNLLCVFVWLMGGGGERGAGVKGEQCVGKDGCGCVFDDGSGTIDVSSLANTDGTARFKAQGKDMYYYSFNPCLPFSELTCKDASVCQVSPDHVRSYQTGDADEALWVYDGVNVQVYYDSVTDILRQTRVTYICNETADFATMTARGEVITTMYELTVTTKYACKTSGSSVVDTGLSVGSILLIVLFVAVCVYLIAGIIYNRIQHQAKGVEMVPNLTFWRLLPGYIKDGCVFTVTSCRGMKSMYREL